MDDFPRKLHIIHSILASKIALHLNKYLNSFLHNFANLPHFYGSVSSQTTSLFVWAPSTPTNLSQVHKNPWPSILNNTLSISNNRRLLPKLHAN